ncbi:interleukin-12 subunit alpha [Cheilinus undulatus]|uniref:interleukin-12 subunit alpha n=1 Tax=Cheilinus undulatus TaxID=241271 RepID=UPI001BD231DB|nr:interleukin-12 subunit alpha [Cheilinus undulatus]
MAFKLYFSPALLLLVFTSPLWYVSQSVPVMSQRPMTDSCISYAQTLLQDITETLTQKNVSAGIDCTKQSVEMNTETNTASVCIPKEAKCSGPMKSEFDQDLCLTNIMDDLRHYYRILSVQPHPNNLISKKILHSLRNLMENCFKMSFQVDLALEEAAADHQSNFDDRLTLCKVLKGFHVRTITINRVISYINSEEHTN